MNSNLALSPEKQKNTKKLFLILRTRGMGENVYTLHFLYSDFSSQQNK